MATIEDYVSGKVCHQLEKSFSIFDAADGSSLEGEASLEVHPKIIYVVPKAPYNGLVLPLPATTSTFLKAPQPSRSASISRGE